MTLHKNQNATDNLKQRLVDTLDCILQGIIVEAIDQWQTWLRACGRKAKGRHFEHLL